MKVAEGAAAEGAVSALALVLVSATPAMSCSRSQNRSTEVQTKKDQGSGLARLAYGRKSIVILLLGQIATGVKSRKRS